MAEEALFCGSEGRGLAFSRAASVLKSLPWTVRSVKDLSSLPGIGEHSRKIIQVTLSLRLLIFSQEPKGDKEVGKDLAENKLQADKFRRT